MLAGIFVYGTLRTGESLSGCLPATAPRKLARARGRLHYAAGSSGIPVMLPPLTCDDWVLGELVEVDQFSRSASNVTAMELEAGYNAEWYRVHTNDGETVDALVYVWRHDDYGSLIPSGDYTRRVETPLSCEFDATETEWCHAHSEWCGVEFATD